MEHAGSPASLSDLPRDELLRYGRSLALSLRDDVPQGELLRLIRARQELLLDVERESLIDLVAWARIPVRASAGKEELVRAVSDFYADDYGGMPRNALEVLALLRGVQPEKGMSDEELARRIAATEGRWKRMRRRRRKLVGDLIDRTLARPSRQAADAYQFLPEAGPAGQLAASGEARGLIGGLARKIKGEIKGAADEYIDAKLDELEARIDRKLDEIDARLAEWRDREIRNRLRIVKITLAATILVAALSLGYNWARSTVERSPARPVPDAVPSGESPAGLPSSAGFGNDE